MRVATEKPAHLVSNGGFIPRPSVCPPPTLRPPAPLGILHPLLCLGPSLWVWSFPLFSLLRLLTCSPTWTAHLQIPGRILLPTVPPASECLSSCISLSCDKSVQGCFRVRRMWARLWAPPPSCSGTLDLASPQVSGTSCKTRGQ